MAPLRRSRHPIGPPPTAPLPLPPSQAGLPGLGGHGTFGGLGALPPLPGPSRRRSSVQEQSSSFGGYTDPFAPLPRIPGQVSENLGSLSPFQRDSIYRTHDHSS